MILAGDIGGTNARIAFFTLKQGRLTVAAEHIYPTHEHRGLESIVRRFIDDHRVVPRCACFGIAGPVRHGRAEMANLKWAVDSSSLAREIGIESVALINDLEANAYGVAALAPNDFAVLNVGVEDPAGNAAVIAAGTGLGEAGLYWDGAAHRPFACEGGHGDFGPTDDLQIELLRFLRAELEHVSVERVLSGPGLFNIYRFLRDTGRGAEPPWLTEQLKTGDPPAQIARAAAERNCELCVRALEIFVAIYGSEAADLALKLMATAGVYIGGGIAPRIIDRLRAPAFMKAFTTKGRMGPLLEKIPVRVILNDQAALLGAARAAALKAGLL
jgi:glucokinase